MFVANTSALIYSESQRNRIDRIDAENARSKCAIIIKFCFLLPNCVAAAVASFANIWPWHETGEETKTKTNLERGFKRLPTLFGF